MEVKKKRTVSVSWCVQTTPSVEDIPVGSLCEVTWVVRVSVAHQVSASVPAESLQERFSGELLKCRVICMPRDVHVAAGRRSQHWQSSRWPFLRVSSRVLPWLLSASGGALQRPFLTTAFGTQAPPSVIGGSAERWGDCCEASRAEEAVVQPMEVAEGAGLGRAALKSPSNLTGKPHLQQHGDQQKTAWRPGGRGTYQHGCP